MTSHLKVKVPLDCSLFTTCWLTVEMSMEFLIPTRSQSCLRCTVCIVIHGDMTIRGHCGLVGRALVYGPQCWMFDSWFPLEMVLMFWSLYLK